MCGVIMRVVGYIKRDMQVFGNFQRLEDYIFASQFLQAEGIRYAVEANRRRAYQNSGSIVWQANESFLMSVVQV